MTEKISIDSALKKAQNMITIPSMVAMFGIIILSYLLGNNGVIPKGFVPLGFLLGIILGWIVWSYQVPKWKIWAYKPAWKPYVFGLFCWRPLLGADLLRRCLFGACLGAKQAQLKTMA